MKWNAVQNPSGIRGISAQSSSAADFLGISLGTYPLHYRSQSLLSLIPFKLITISQRQQRC